MLTKEELTSIPVWMKFHSVHVAAFTAHGLSATATRLCTPIMLDSCTTTTYIESCTMVSFVLRHCGTCNRRIDMIIAMLTRS
nr:hypothetical protein [Tanacetum cinerariifolium]